MPKSKKAPVVEPEPVVSSEESSESEASPEPEIVEKVKKVDKKGKKVSKKYLGPKGMEIVENSANLEAAALKLDWETIQEDPELELWAIRVPVGVRPKDLSGLSIQLPKASSSTNSKPLVTFSAKKVEYSVYLADTLSVESNKRKRDESERSTVGGDEMKALVPLLPKRSAADKLFLAPRAITHSLLITRVLPPTVLSHLPSAASSLITSQPAPVPGAVLTAEEVLQSNGQHKKPKRSQPLHLKTRLVVSGMKGFNKKRVDSGDVEMDSE